MRRVAFFAVVACIAVLITAGCSRKREPAVSIEEIRKDMGMPVRVVPAEVRKLSDRILVSGTVEVPNEVNLTPEVGGRVVAIYKDKGDAVSKGDRLLQINKEDYELGYAQAKAAYEMAKQQLAMARTGARPEELEQVKNMMDQAEAGHNVLRKTYKRTKELYEQGVVSRQQLDGVEAELIAAEKQFGSAKEQLQMAKGGARQEEIKLLEAQADQAKAAMGSAQLMLKRTTVVSTVAGIISYRFFKLGESVGPNNAVYQILGDGPKKITFTINEGQLHRIKEGDEVVFRATGIEDVEYVGRITYVSRFVRKMTREAEIEAIVVDEPVPLAHGMFVEGNIILPDIEAFVIPYKSLIENRFVMIVEGDTGFVRTCDDTKRIGAYVEIKDDCVKPGEQVVFEGQGILEDGMKVRVLQDEAP